MRTSRPTYLPQFANRSRVEIRTPTLPCLLIFKWCCQLHLLVWVGAKTAKIQWLKTFHGFTPKTHFPVFNVQTVICPRHVSNFRQCPPIQLTSIRIQNSSSQLGKHVLWEQLNAAGEKGNPEYLNFWPLLFELVLKPIPLRQRKQRVKLAIASMTIVASEDSRYGKPCLRD